MSYTVHPQTSEGVRTKFNPQKKKETKRNVKHFNYLNLNEVILNEDELGLDLKPEVEEAFYK